MAETLGELIVRLGLDASSFTRGMSDIDRQIRVQQSSFKTFGTEAQKSGTNVDFLTAKQKALTTEIELQTRKVVLYTQEQEKTRTQIEKLGKEHEDLAKKVSEAKKAYEDSVGLKGKDADETKKLKDEYQALNKQYDENDEKLNKAARAYDNKSVAVNNANGKLIDFKKSLEDTNTQLQLQESKLFQAGQHFKSFGDLAQEAGKGIETIGKGMMGVGKDLTMAITTPVVAMGTASVNAAKDFEQAFTGVTKTVEMTADETQKMRQSIIEMSETLPHSKEAIAGVAQAAGQLGVDKKHISDFTEVMLNMGVSTDLTATQAAESMARFANITKMPQTEFENLGSAIVDLGNKFATTEPEILEMGLRIAGAGAVAGMTEGDILGLAAALSSVGINAEMGGSAISRVIIQMAVGADSMKGNIETIDSTGHSLSELRSIANTDAKSFKELAESVGLTSKELKEVMNQQSGLEDFGRVAGMTGEQFARAFGKDPADALSKFILGLGQMDEEGQSAITTLQEMGLTEIRVRDALLRSANASELFASAIKTGNEAYEKNVALADEAAKFNDTFASRMEVLGNRINSIAIEVGETLIPVLEDLIDDYVEPLIEWWKKLDTEQQKNIIKWAATAAAIGPVLVGLGKFLTITGKITQGVGKISSAIGEASTAIAGGEKAASLLGKAFQGIGTSLAPGGTVLSGLTGVVAPAGVAAAAVLGIFYALDKKREAALEDSRAFEEAMKRQAESVTPFSEAIENATWLTGIMSVEAIAASQAAHDAFTQHAGSFKESLAQYGETTAETVEELTTLGDTVAEAFGKSHKGLEGLEEKQAEVKAKTEQFQADLASLVTEVSGGITQSTNESLNAMRELYLANDGVIDEEESKALDAIKTNGAKRQTEIQGIQDQILTIFSTAMETRGTLTETEQKRIESLVGMIETLNAKALQTVQLQQEAALAQLQTQIDMGKMNDDVAASGIKTSKELANARIADAEKTRQAEYLTLQERLNAGELTEIQANSTRYAIEKRYEAEVEAARTASAETLSVVAEWKAKEIAGQNGHLDNIKRLTDRRVQLVEEEAARLKNEYSGMSDELAKSIAITNVQSKLDEINRDIAKSLKYMNADTVNSFITLVAQVAEEGGKLGPETQKMVQSILDAMDGIPAEMKEDGLVLVGALISGLEEASPELAAAWEKAGITDPLEKLRNLASGFTDVGKESADAYVDGLDNRSAEAGQAGKRLSEATIIQMALAQGEFEGVGSKYVDGIIEGVEKRKAALQAKMSEVYQMMIQTGMIDLEVNSPSKAAMRLSAFYMEGLGKGIEDNIDLMLNPMHAATEELMKASVVNPTWLTETPTLPASQSNAITKASGGQQSIIINQYLTFDKTTVLDDATVERFAALIDRKTNRRIQQALRLQTAVIST